MSANLIDIALNQTVEWKQQKKRLDGFAQRRYKDPATIPCRVSMKQRLVLDAGGEEKISTAMITTLASVKTGDLIGMDGREFIVLAVTEPATFAGTIHRRKVYI